MYGYIYKITNKITNKIYIGKREKSSFDNSYWGSGKHIKYSIKKYGKENFSREIIEWCKTRERLLKREAYWVKKLDCRNPKIGYNITEGGLGAVLTGELNGMYGKKHTLEARKKMSLHHCYIFTPERNKKISNSLKGHPVSVETRKKISESNKGEKAWNKGKHGIYSQDVIEKMRASAIARGFPPEQHAKAIATIKSHHYHWYNNGVISTKFREGQQPKGYKLGRIYKLCKSN